jgi:sugar phosphate isomerase/epimerase
MAMQIGPLIPGEGVDLQVHAANFDHAGLIRQLHGQGFNPIELGGDLSLFVPHAFSAETVAALLALRREIGVTYTVHLPLWSVEPSTPLTPVRLGSVQAVTEIIRATAPLDPEVYVLHATGALAAEFYQMRLPARAKETLLRSFQAGARASIRQILADTAIPSRKLAIETIEFPFDLTWELAEELDLSICLDTGHVLSGFPGRSDLFGVLDHILPRLAEIHLHDSPHWTPGAAIVYGKDHQALGNGALDMARFLRRLDEAGWDGPIIFELTIEEALASREVVQDHGRWPESLDDDG